jgi:hypothetical protein
MRAMTEHRPDRRPNDLFAAAEMFRAAARRLVRQDS